MEATKNGGSFHQKLFIPFCNFSFDWNSLISTEISAFLKLKSETIYALINKEGLPASKVGGQWRFDIEEVKAWFKQQRQPQ